MGIATVFGMKALLERDGFLAAARRGACGVIVAASLQGAAAGSAFDEALAGGSNAERVALAKSYEAAGGEAAAVKAARLFHAAAAEGDAEAQYGMSRLYGEGRGVRARPDKAFVWALAAARQGHAEAQNLLGVYLSDGTGVKADARSAADWFRKAAFQGNVKAQFNLGACFEAGDGVERDAAQAVQWYRKAAESGCVPALFRMGVCCEMGIGLGRDAAQAATWYARAAAAGDIDGQFAFGRCLERGLGVAAQAAEALTWYRKAAAQGDDRARQRILFLEYEETAIASTADGRLGLAGLRLGMPIQTAAIVLERALRKIGADAMLFVAETGTAARVASGRDVEIRADADGNVTSIYLERGMAAKLLGLQNPSRVQILAAAAKAAGLDPADAVEDRRRIEHRGQSLGTQEIDVLGNPAGDSLVCFGSYAGLALPETVGARYRPIGSLLLQQAE
jgi:TPR repeat protein